MTAAPFGRRSAGKPHNGHPPTPAKFFQPAAPVAPAAPTPSVEAEIEAWKKARGPSQHIKLLALAASLCFGIASFVLPDSVNEWVQYPLYALTAAGLYVGFRHKRIKAR